ncbi:hypothetical protein GUJ93_ZPchr0008g11884 [Zizania palustris]|uniref:Uncharacterized protein n=1 Tax=Zizania palustris TaxID=103762 RepID=A0A8J5R5Q3_ZIZPA|nr:hypothetical protein GUJ93_ZPchr0008g11884 [Zizania palustris]
MQLEDMCSDSEHAFSTVPPPGVAQSPPASTHHQPGRPGAAAPAVPGKTPASAAAAALFVRTVCDDTLNEDGRSVVCSCYDELLPTTALASTSQRSASYPEWEIKDGCVFFHIKAKETQPCKEIPSFQVINQPG